MPLLTSLWQIRQGLKNSTYVLLEFYLWCFSVTSQSLWCFVGKQTSNLWSGYLSLSFTPWLRYIYGYPITVDKSFATTLQIILFYLLFLSDCDFQVLLRDAHHSTSSLQTLPVLCPVFCGLIHFLHVSIYFIKNGCFSTQELKNDQKKKAQNIVLNNTELKMLHIWNSKALQIISTESIRFVINANVDSH